MPLSKMGKPSYSLLGPKPTPPTSPPRSLLHRPTRAQLGLTSPLHPRSPAAGPHLSRPAQLCWPSPFLFHIGRRPLTRPPPPRQPIPFPLLETRSTSSARGLDGPYAVPLPLNPRGASAPGQEPSPTVPCPLSPPRRPYSEPRIRATCPEAGTDDEDCRPLEP